MFRWGRSTDIEQRNGRGIRQGNINDKVSVLYYSTKGTFDNYRWQLLEKKQQIISQIMSGKPAARSCDDVDEVTLTFAEMKAATTGNPLLAEKMTVNNEVNRLKLLQNSHYQQQLKFERDINERFPKLIEKKRKVLAVTQKDAEYISRNPFDKEAFKITLNSRVYDERTKAGAVLESTIKEFLAPINREITEKEIGCFNGFTLAAVKDGMTVSLRLQKEGRYYSDYTFSGTGGITRICNLYERIPEQVTLVQRELEEASKQLENAKLQYGKPFPYEQELRDNLERQSQINSELEFGEHAHHIEEVVGEDDEEFEMEM